MNLSAFLSVFRYLLTSKRSKNATNPNKSNNSPPRHHQGVLYSVTVFVMTSYRTESRVWYIVSLLIRYRNLSCQRSTNTVSFAVLTRIESLTKMESLVWRIWMIVSRVSVLLSVIICVGRQPERRKTIKRRPTVSAKRRRISCFRCLFMENNAFLCKNGKRKKRRIIRKMQPSEYQRASSSSSFCVLWPRPVESLVFGKLSLWLLNNKTFRGIYRHTLYRSPSWRRLWL